MKLKKEKKVLINSFDRLYQTILVEDQDPFDQMLELSDILLDGRPVLVVFSELKDEKQATHVLAFLSGVVYALDGSVYAISSETYLFASKEALKDGSLDQYINEVVKE